MKTNALLFINNAQMAKLADASDLNSDDYYNHAGSIPALSTFINLKTIIMRAKKSIRAWVAWEDNEPTRVYIRIAQYDNQKKLFKQYTHKYQ